MLNNAICFIAICYGFKGSLRLWKQHAKSDAIVLLLVYGVIVAYLIPFIGSPRPNVESLYRFIYGPISNYVRDLLKIRLED